MYTKNVGRNDKAIRYVFAIILLLIVAFYDFNLTVRWVIGILGVILFITAYVSWCPMYSILNTSSKGHGLDKITKRDIETAVKEYSVKDAKAQRVEVGIISQTPKMEVNKPSNKKPVIKKKASSAKKATKTVTKKAIPKKTSSPKKATIKKTPVKKTPTKKAVTKKKTVSKSKK